MIRVWRVDCRCRMPEMVMKAQEDKELARVLQGADLVIPDGAGVLWAAEQQGKKFKERVTGCDVAELLLKEAAARQTPVYLYGAADGVAETVAANMEKRYGKLMAGRYPLRLFSAAEGEDIIREIREQGTKILLVALGV